MYPDSCKFASIPVYADRSTELFYSKRLFKTNKWFLKIQLCRILIVARVFAHKQQQICQRKVVR